MQKWKKGITLHGVKENTHELANWCSTIITEEPSVLIPKATLFLDEANYMERRWLYLCVVKTLHSCSLINSFTCIICVCPFMKYNICSLWSLQNLQSMHVWVLKSRYIFLNSLYPLTSGNLFGLFNYPNHGLISYVLDKN